MIRYFKLFDLLARRGHNKSDLKTLAGLSAPTIAKLSKGGYITTEVIDRICAALNVQPGEIMEYTHEEH